MEARQTLRGSSISKTFVAIVLFLVAVGLGVMGAYVANSLSGSHAASITKTDAIPAAPGTGLRKNFDNYPAQPAGSQPTRPLHVE